MNVCIFGSGSTGNATFISDGKTHILIDAGLSSRRLSRSLSGLNISPEDLSAIFISHEHTDHIKGLSVFTKHFKVPIIASEGTMQAIAELELDTELIQFKAGEIVRIGSLEIDTFPISHDAIDPCAFNIRSNGIKISHVTDLGFITKVVKQRISGAHCLIIESNHDEEMLKIGPYPWQLKQRVLSRLGHLSNKTLAQFLENDFDGSAQTIVMAHLSRTNNHPEIVRFTAEDALSKRSFAKNNSTELIIARHDSATKLIKIE